jgi:hypothetical protein
MSTRNMHNAQVIDSPDKSAQKGWKELLDYSRTLCNVTRAPWHLTEPQCLHVDVQVKLARGTVEEISCACVRV